MLIKILNTTNGIGTSLTTEDLKDIIDEIFNEQRAIIDGTPINEEVLRLATPVQANNGSRIFAWLNEVPGVEEWLGTKVYGDLKESNYMLRNRYYYNALTLHKKEIRHNGLIDVPMLLRSMLELHRDHKKELIMEAITAGTTNLAFDGLPFFDDIGGVRVNDNLLAGTGVTLAALKLDVATARTAMMKFKTAKGRYLRLMPDTIVCPVALEGVFRELMEATNDTAAGDKGVPNIVGKYIKNIISDPVLDADDANDWYFMCTTKTLKPFIVQTEDMSNGQEYESVLDDTKYAGDGILGYSIESGKVVGYGFPECAIKVVNT